MRWEDRAAQDQSYVVQRGDTLYSIAFRHQLDFRDLARWNGIGRNYLIYPGQTLSLRGASASTAPTATARRAPPPAAAPPVSAPTSTPVKKPAAAPPRNGSRPAPAPGPYRWQWPVTGPILERFNAASGRKGVDIAGREGEPVRASAAGKVVYSGSALKGYGQLVIIKHGDEYLSAYGHNRKLLVAEGDSIDAGQIIAELGLGPQRKPLLHFEIRRYGKPLDPLSLLPPTPS